MHATPHLFSALISSGFCGGQGVFLTQRAQSFTQGAQRGYGGKWCSTTTEAENALWGGTAHREADGREYHPVKLPRRLTAPPLHLSFENFEIPHYGNDEGELGYDACGRQCRQAMRTRLCGGISADLTFLHTFLVKQKSMREEGRAGGISMSLEFLVLFFQEKSTAEINMNGRLYDPEIGRFFSPDKYVHFIYKIPKLW